jgi:general secretion pathway protein A
VYHQFFNLREMPFTITPDPAYLYLSPRHQEALGHLLYGTGQYGGFVQLTGEVGTGKTTIVRTLLEQKLGEVDVAIIHNPRQSELEFVQSICDELHVDYPRDKTPTLKTLVDALNRHLLRAHAAGRRTVLIIDEAQNLERNVLEQVRLLTNLETAKEKLLRIMLIGQPELIELLARPDLRQLASRITARYHLMPLDERETAEYIRHRLRVAGTYEEIFSDAAIREIHGYSRGVPRQINILCDRAMLGAYGTGTRRISPEMVRTAAVESIGVAPSPQRQGARRRRPLLWLEAALIAAALVLTGLLVYRTFGPEPIPAGVQASGAPGDSRATPASAGATPETAPVAGQPRTAATESQAAPQAHAASAPDTETLAAQPAADAPPTVDLSVLMESAAPLTGVMNSLIRLWDDSVRVPAGENVCRALSMMQLECYKGAGEWRDLKQIDRPAILPLTNGRGEIEHMLLLGLNDQWALLDTEQGPVRVALQDLDAVWTGDYLVLWRREIPDTFLAPGASGDSVIWLRKRLAEASGGSALPPLSPRFDMPLRDEVTHFQETHGLAADGLVGVRTLISLGNDRPDTPKLRNPA